MRPKRTPRERPSEPNLLDPNLKWIWEKYKYEREPKERDRHKKTNIYRSRKLVLSHLLPSDVFELTYEIFDRKTFYLEKEQGELMDVVR